MEQSITTEQQILEAARKVFALKGMDGARMQEIADEAGINKALLHYYFRSKENLFLVIFQEGFSQLLMNVNTLIDKQIPLSEKLELFIDNYLDLLTQNPYLPSFVLTEINRNPERIIEFFTSHNIKYELLIQQISALLTEGDFRETEARNLIVNVISLCIFPFIGRPLIKKLLFLDNEESFQEFIQQRRRDVKKFVFASLPGTLSIQ